MHCIAVKSVIGAVLLAVLGLAWSQTCPPTGNTWIDDPSSCPGYIACKDGVGTPGQCEKPYQFFPENGGYCSYAVGDCYAYWTTLAPGVTTTTTVGPEVTTTTVDPAVTTTPGTETTTDGSGSTTVAAECLPGDIHKFPHERECATYFRCYNEVADLFECAPGLYFSPTELQCMQPALSGCVVNPCPEIDEETIKIVPDDEDCNAYFVCTLGEPVRETCAPGLVFDLTINDCNLPENSDTSHCDAGSSSPSPDVVLNFDRYDVVDEMM